MLHTHTHTPHYFLQRVDYNGQIYWTFIVILLFTVRKHRKGKPPSRLRLAARRRLTVQWCMKAPMTEAKHGRRPHPSTCSHHMQPRQPSASRWLFGSCGSTSSNLLDGRFWDTWFPATLLGLGNGPCDIGSHIVPVWRGFESGRMGKAHPPGSYYWLKRHYLLSSEADAGCRCLFASKSQKPIDTFTA